MNTVDSEHRVTDPTPGPWVVLDPRVHVIVAPGTPDAFGQPTMIGTAYWAEVGDAAEANARLMAAAPDLVEAAIALLNLGASPRLREWRAAADRLNAVLDAAIKKATGGEA